jgi:hypothetical protein
MHAGVKASRLLVENYSALHLGAQTSIIRSPEAGNRIPELREEQRSLAPVVENDVAGHWLVDDPAYDAFARYQNCLGHRC